MEKKIAVIDPVGIKAGMDYYNMSLLKALSQKGISTFLYSNLSASSNQVTIKNVFGAFYSSKIKQGFNLLKATLQSCLDCRKNSVDTVILHLFSTQFMTFVVFLTCKIFGFKIIAIAHDVSSFAGDDSPIFRSLIYNRFSDKIVVHNTFSYDFLVPLLQLKSVNKVSVIKHGSFVDMPDDSVSKLQAREGLGLSSNGKYILFFGQIKKVKRLDVLINAMKDVQPDVKLIVAGKVWKDDFSIYQDLIQKNGLEDRVILDIQFISNKKKEWYFKSADLMALPYENIFQSGVLLTAMSYGIATVCSDIPPFKEVINDGFDGFLFEKNNSSDLAEKINQMVVSDAPDDSVGNFARQKMLTDYSWLKISSDYLEIL